MPEPIRFYFDFASPFSYFALQRIPDIARKHGRALHYIPVDLAELKQRTGNTAPPARTMPIKIKYMKEDQRRWAKRYGVPIATPAHYNSTLLNKGAFFAIDRGKPEEYLRFAYRRVWGEGASMIDEAMLNETVQHCGWREDDFFAFIASPEAEQRYRQATREAHEAGVFGVPAMLTDGEMWWGNDRFDFLEE